MIDSSRWCLSPTSVQAAISPHLFRPLQFTAAQQLDLLPSHQPPLLHMSQNPDPRLVDVRPYDILPTITLEDERREDLDAHTLYKVDPALKHSLRHQANPISWLGPDHPRRLCFGRNGFQYSKVISCSEASVDVAYDRSPFILHVSHRSILFLHDNIEECARSFVTAMFILEVTPSLVMTARSV
jgi:hypothetical protein